MNTYELKILEKEGKQAIYYQKILDHIDLIFLSVLHGHKSLKKKELDCIYYAITSTVMFASNMNLISSKQTTYITNKAFELL